MRFRILGPIEAARAGTTLDLGGPRHRKLLAVLLVHAGEVVSTERLIQALWGDEPPEGAAAALHVRVSELRKALRGAQPGADAGLLTRGSGYLLQVGADELDARCVERLAAAGREALARGEHAKASESLREALALWRGPALMEVADQPFAQTEVARLESLRLQASEDRMEADLRLGRHRELVVELETMVAEHPLRERFWAQLMLAQYRAGRQAEALRTYQAARELLVERFGIDPGAELQRLHGAVLRHDPALDLPATAAGGGSRKRSTLPAPLTSFVGREGELTEVRALLETGRLVTLTGVGGVGKSRLALAAAAGWQADHPDGTWLVELAAVAQPGLVIHVVATMFGVREQPRRRLLDLVAEYIGSAEVLFVLDNCEHLVGEVAELAQRLLEGCPRLRILATSRERLGITGEVLHPVSGLTVPEAGSRSVAAVGRAEAAQLFVERAAAVQPGFCLTEGTAVAVAYTTRCLDGLPLAIELAAARVNAFDIVQIADRLDDRFQLLTRGDRTALPRHQTLRAVVDWSYELLDDAERRVFDVAAVFAGGFTLEAAEAVCADSGPVEAGVAGLVARLVDKSLLVADATGEGPRRYLMLETLRVYGLERLDESGGTGRVRERHAAFFLAFAERAGAALHGPKQSAWLARLQTEHGNIRAALEWSIGQGDAVTAARLAGALYQFWDLHGHYTEGRRWLTRVLGTAGPMPPAVRVRALLACGGLAVIQGDLRYAVAAGEQAAAVCEEAGDPGGLAHALQFLGFVAIYTEELDRAMELSSRALDSARAANHRWLEGRSLLFLSIAALARGEYDRAAQAAAECAEVLRPVGDADSLAGALVIRATAAWRLGDHGAAAAFLRDGLRAYQGLGGLWGLSLGLAVVAYLVGSRGDHQRATVILGASEAVRESIGAVLVPIARVWHETGIAAATAALGADAFRRAWEAGQALTPDDAVIEAMKTLDLIGRPAAATR